MKHPPGNVEHYEYNLGKAPDLRCEYQTTTTSCDKCESCQIRGRLTGTGQWFARAGEQTRKAFALGLIRRFRSVTLLHYTVSLLHPLVGKDYTYARSRTSPGVAGDGASTGSNRALGSGDIDEKMAECWRWFKGASYWSKCNYLLAILQMCNGELLHSIGTLARTMLSSEQRAPVECSSEDYEQESLADTVYSYTCEIIPKDALAGINDGSSRATSSHRLDSYDAVDDPEKDDDSDDEMSSLDPTLRIMPTSRSALAGVRHRVDYIRQVPVHLAKNILSYLDYGDLVNCMSVSRHWARIAKEVEEDFRTRQLLWEEVMLMQGSSVQGGNPVYANHRDIPVPRLIGGCRAIAPSDLPVLEVDFKSEVTVATSYSGIVTDSVPMEERNVYCGPYNVMVLTEQEDVNRVVSYNYGQLVAIGSFDRHIRFLDVSTGHETGPVLRGHAGSIRCLYTDDRNGYVLSGSFDTSIRCWDVCTGRCMKIFHGHQDTVVCLDMNKDSEELACKRVVSGGKDNVVKVWNFNTGRCLCTFKHTHLVAAVAVHGDTVVSGCEGGRVKVWSIKDACLVKVLYQSPKNTNQFGFANPHTHQGPITSVKLDHWHIVSGSRDGYALIWSAVGEHKRCIAALRHPKGVLCLELSYLRVITGCEDGKLRIWNMLSGDCLRVMRGNSRSDPIENIYPCGERLVVHTDSNLLVLNFEEVQWDYDQVEKVELLHYKNHYGDAPLRKHTYPFVRAQRSERAGASNPKILHHSRGPRSPEGDASIWGSQLGHSTRALHARNLMSAKKIQSRVRDVEFVSSVKGSVYHNVQGLGSSRPSTGMSRSRPLTAASRRPHTGMSTARSSRSLQIVGSAASATRSRPPTGISTGTQWSRPHTALTTRSGPIGEDWFEQPLRHRQTREALSLSEAKALLRSHLRTQDTPTPRDKLLLSINCIESSKKNTVVVKHTVANALEIDCRPRLEDATTPHPSEAERMHPGVKMTQPLRTATRRESSAGTRKEINSIHGEESTPSATPKQLAMPQQSKRLARSARPSSGHIPTANCPEIVRRSHSASAVLRSADREGHPPEVRVAAASCNKTFHGWTTSHTEPLITAPMLIQGAKRRSHSATKVVVTPPPPRVEVRNPLQNRKAFQLHTREQTADYASRIMSIYQQDAMEKNAQAEALRRKLWLTKVRGQGHVNFNKKSLAPEIRE